MTATNDANLGLSLGWTYGEDNWNTGMDINLAVLGATSQLYVKSKTTGTKPVSPTDGDRYYIPVGAIGDWSSYEKYLAVYSAYHANWIYVPVKKGWEFRVEDDSNNSYYFDGTNLVSSVSLAGYLTASSTYTATGVVTFSNAPKFSGSHSIDPTELATMGDVDTKIAAIDYSTFVRTTGNQTVGGIKTFSSSPVIPNATNSNQAASKGQIDTAVGAITGANVGTGANVFKDKSGSSIRLRSLVAGSNVTITEGADEITIAASGGGGSFDPDAPQTINAPWTFVVPAGQSFRIVDDAVSPTMTFTVSNQDAAAPTGVNTVSMSMFRQDGDDMLACYAYQIVDPLDENYHAGAVINSISNAGGNASTNLFLDAAGVGAFTCSAPKVMFPGIPVYADNAAALAAGLPVGADYNTPAGVRMVVMSV